MKFDDVINIAIGRSRKEINYINKSVRYSDFINYNLRNTTYTNETFKEYMNFPKDIQDNIKDVGGFVGGVLKDGKRRKDTVISRSLITLDADFAYENMIEDIEKSCDFGMCIYTTHKHTKENPRLKEGIIGAFCRVYNVFDVIDKFLSNVYKRGD
ncbi:MAG: hypothetical protein RSD14_05935, partial [Clostridia bacterium]